MDKYAELIGLGAGVVAGAGMMVSPKSRAAGMVGIVTAFLTNGLRAAEAFTSKKQQLKDATGSLATIAVKAGGSYEAMLTAVQDQLKVAESGTQGALGAVTASPVTAFQGGGLGMVQAEQRQLLAGNGLGITSVDQVPTLSALGQGGLGAVTATPTESFGNLSSHYGASLFGGRN
jgi:hypothetical protein